MEIITLRAFLHLFCKNIREDKKYCFILGSGASKPSGIRTGGELVHEWMSQIEDRYGHKDTEHWMNEERIIADELEKDYSKIYSKRFELDKKEGFAFLEKLMENREPSCGYSVLAQILAATHHKIVITTNFDSLTEDALFIYTQKKPLVVGHEALANYIDPFGTRPIIVKIHRDLFLSPKNSDVDTDELEKDFERNLANIFKYYTPLVIGYGGNDGSLMGFLENLGSIEGGIFWFYRNKNGEPNQRIQNLIEKFNGRAIPIPGFDELMIQIGNDLELELLDEKIVQIAKQRAAKYREQIEKITKEKTVDAETKNALTDIASRGEKDWWYYGLEATKQDDMNKRDEIYLEGIRALPNSSELIGNYAVFLSDIRKEYDKAEELYKKAIELEPDGANWIGNYAIFLDKFRKEYDKAEELYKKAIELEPDGADWIGNYAIFLSDIRKEHDKAEELFKKAIELKPDGADWIGNYAIFLKNIRKEYDKAEELFKKAIELKPDDADWIGKYAIFLKNIRKEYDKAEELFKKAIELEPDDADWIGNYAVFLSDIRKEYDKAEELYKKAIELKPNSAELIGNYAKSLIVKRDLQNARKSILKAFELNQNENEDLNLELWFYRYAVFFDEYPKANAEIEGLLKKGIKSTGWYLDDVLAAAKELGHPDYEKLCELEKRITAS